jgi:group I intron endonuclease
MYYIYAIRQKSTNKYYIGSTNNFKNRFYRHKSSLKLNKHHSIKLQRTYNKYGLDDLEFIVIENVKNKKQLFIREQHHIDDKNAYHKGFNCRPDACFHNNDGDNNGMFGNHKKTNLPSIRRRPITRYNILTGEIQNFSYLIEAQKNGGSIGGISQCLQGIRIRCLEYFFFYTDEYNLDKLKTQFEKYNSTTKSHLKLDKKPNRKPNKTRQLPSNTGKSNYKSISIIRSDGKKYESMNLAAQDLKRNCSNIVGHIRYNIPKSVAGYTFKIIE